MSAKPKLTPWFRPDQKPVRDGVYRAQDRTMNCHCCWIELEYRRGEWFSNLCEPDRFSTHFWQRDLKRWRGLAENPSPSQGT